MRRVVLDTSVIVAALRSRNGASHTILRLVAARRLVPLATAALFLQYEDVLKRPGQRAATGLSEKGVDQRLAAMADAIEPVKVYFHWRPQLPDAGDEMVLETAINGRADALITFNVRDFIEAGRMFGVPVLRPGEALAEILDEHGN